MVDPGMVRLNPGVPPNGGADALEDRPHVRNIRCDDKERPFNRTTRYSAQAVGTPRAGRHRHLDVTGRAVDARAHAVVDHRFEERQPTHDQPGWRGACGGERRVLRLPRAPRAICEGSGYRFSTDSDSEIAVHLYRERGMQAATKLRGEFAVIIADERQQADDRDPRPLRGQAALLRSGERRRVLRVGDQGTVGAGCAGRMGSRGRYRRYGQIPREDRVRRDQYGAAGLLCDRQGWRCSHLSVLGLGDPDC